jgi:PAS domain S-box-containing protein
MNAMKFPGCTDRLFTDRKMGEYENHWVTRSGEKRFIHWKKHILPDNDGAPLFIVATGIDITDRRNAEEALKLERERSQTILDNVNVGIILMDVNGALITFNKTVLEWYGYLSEREMKTHSQDYIMDFELRDTEEKIIPFESWPAPRAVKGEYVTNSGKTRKKESGDVRWISLRQFRFLDCGERLHAFQSLADITERKNIEM